MDFLNLKNILETRAVVNYLGYNGDDVSRVIVSLIVNDPTPEILNEIAIELNGSLIDNFPNLEHYAIEQNNIKAVYLADEII
jgi:hypothetical protein